MDKSLARGWSRDILRKMDGQMVTDFEVCAEFVMQTILSAPAGRAGRRIINKSVAQAKAALRGTPELSGNLFQRIMSKPDGTYIFSARAHISNAVLINDEKQFNDTVIACVASMITSKGKYVEASRWMVPAHTTGHAIERLLTRSDAKVEDALGILYKAFTEASICSDAMRCFDYPCIPAFLLPAPGGAFVLNSVTLESDLKSVYSNDNNERGMPDHYSGHNVRRAWRISTYYPDKWLTDDQQDALAAMDQWFEENAPYWSEKDVMGYMSVCNYPFSQVYGEKLEKLIYIMDKCAIAESKKVANG